MSATTDSKRAKRQEPWYLRDLYGDGSGDDVEEPPEEEVNAAIEDVVQRALIYVPKIGDNPSLLTDLGLSKFMRTYGPDIWGQCLVRFAEVAPLADLQRHLVFYSVPSIIMLRPFPTGLQVKFKALRNDVNTTPALRQKFDQIIYDFYRSNPTKQSSDDLKGIIRSYLIESTPIALGLLRILLHNYPDVVNIDVMVKLYDQEKGINPKLFWTIREHPTSAVYFGQGERSPLEVVDDVRNSVEDVMGSNMTMYVMSFV